jgi:TonB family protein
MKQRLTRARALVAVKSYTAAAFELEKIRRESADPSVQNIALMLLMNSYLENGDYKRTQEILGETFGVLKSSQGSSSSSYFTVSGQIVKMARGQMERYKQLGLNISDSNIPAEAVAELDKMRGVLEVIVNQIKELGDTKNKRSAEAFGLLEEVTNTRSAMARDAYDATRWKNEVADARERIAYAQNSIVHIVDESENSAALAAKSSNTVSASLPGISGNSSTNGGTTGLQTGRPGIEDILIDTKATNPVPASAQNAGIMKPVESKPLIVGGEDKFARPRTNPVEKTVQQTPAATEPKASGDSTALIGSLIEMATKKVQPVYPPLARNMRVAGVVRVDLLVDEQGGIVSAQAVQGPDMLKRAALDAIKQWKFKPILRDGQATRASGFINFNFSL